MLRIETAERCRPGHPSQNLQDRLLGGEAIEQPVPAGTSRIGLAAATVWSARGVRGVPRS